MDIRVSEELWATAMAPEGLLERWRVADGAPVRRGEAIAEVRIEECLHDIVAPDDGRNLRDVRPFGGMLMFGPEIVG